MRAHVPSPTALKVAALRALHQTAEDPPVFVDPLAERILGSAAADLVDVYRLTAADSRRLRATLAVRAVVAEQAVADAVARGVRQYVVLGAGLDTFAYRNAEPTLCVFEVDHPATQAWKRDLLRGAAIEVPSSLCYAAVDFERDDLLAELTGAGLNLARPVVFAMLGVIFYLRRDPAFATLRRIADRCAPGSEIVFDYTEPWHDADPMVRAGYEAAAARVAAGGEPWVSFFETAELHEALRGFGFTRIDDVDAAALNARYCAGRTDGLAVAPLLHLLRARK